MDQSNTHVGMDVHKKQIAVALLRPGASEAVDWRGEDRRVGHPGRRHARRTDSEASDGGQRPGAVPDDEDLAESLGLLDAPSVRLYLAALADEGLVRLHMAGAAEITPEGLAEAEQLHRDPRVRFAQRIGVLPDGFPPTVRTPEGELL